MPKTALILLSLTPFLPWQANADSFFDESWYVSGMLSYVDDDVDRDVDNGYSGYHLGFGKDFNPVSSVEFSAIGASFNADGADADQDQWGLGVDYIGRFSNVEFFVPYLVIGGGFIRTQNKNPSEKDGSGAMVSAGLGVLTPLSLFGLKLRTELRVRADNSVGIRRDFLLSLGLQRAIKPKPVLVSDRDGDGVADSDDLCGDTPRNVTVDRYGCARTADSDRDGVTDDEDMCGDTPPGAAVDAAGCRRSDDAVQ